MSTSDQQRRRPLLLAIAIAAIVMAAATLWLLLAPGPTQFAAGQRVQMANFNGGNPSGAPATLAGAGVIERGEYLARAADCESCHTAPGGYAYTGGRVFALPFGTLYSTNLTPDPATGIGRYSDSEFLGALQRGIGRGGRPLYPAMPFASYSLMSDADALAIKAYLFSLQPVAAATPADALRFPFDQRWLMSIWSTLFNPDKRFQANVTRSAQWNRGAYLTEALGHCGECHTPRNLFQALDHRRKFAGAIQAGWRAYNITSDPESGVGAFSDAELAHYLASGHADGRGTAAGPMGEAVDHSLRYLTSSDIAAMVDYLRSVPAQRSPDLPSSRLAAAPGSHREGIAANSNPIGKTMFEEACASCHGWTGVSPLTPAATLVGARAVNDPTAVNVAQVVLMGSERGAAASSVFMPAFGAVYSDAEIAAVANYATARFGAVPSSISAQQVAQLRRAQ